MSQKRDDLVALRTRIMVGDPPYDVDPVMGKKVRKIGNPGLQELREIGNYGAGASGTVLALDAIVQLIDHMLERLK